MVNGKKKKKERQYPPFWDKFIPIAVAIITGIIALLILATIRVALGLTAF